VQAPGGPGAFETCACAAGASLVCVVAWAAEAGGRRRKRGMLEAMACVDLTAHVCPLM
jgi:hypothetical protein